MSSAKRTATSRGAKKAAPAKEATVAKKGESQRVINNYFNLL